MLPAPDSSAAPDALLDWYEDYWRTGDGRLGDMLRVRAEILHRMQGHGVAHSQEPFQERSLSAEERASDDVTAHVPEQPLK